MASYSLLTKILADFLSGVYLLNSVLKHTTNLIHKRWQTVEKLCHKKMKNLILRNG